MMKATLLGLAVVLASGTGGLAQTVQTGQDAHDLGDYELAMSKWLPQAEDGDADAQMKIAGMYDSGEGVAEDDAEALEWFRKAAMSGDVEAQVTVGNRYWLGSGVEQDYLLAFAWLDVAARNGSMYAASRRDAIGNKLSGTQKSNAHLMAQNCITSNYSSCP